MSAEKFNLAMPTIRTLLRDGGGLSVFVLVLATTVGAAVRLIGLDAQSLWIDEYLWSVLGSKGLATIVHNPDGYPPLYGALIHFLLHAGLDSDWWLRLPSAIAGTLAIPVVYLVGRQVGNRTVAATASALLAIHPMAIWYSQEVGAYSLLMLCALTSTLCFLRLLNNGGLRSAVGYALFASIGFGFHYYFIFVVAAHAFVACLDFIRHPDRRREWLWTCFLTLGAVGAWWGPFFASDFANQAAGDSLRSFSWLALPYTMVTFIGGFSFGPPLRELHPAVSIGASAWEAVKPHFASTLLAIAVIALLAGISFTQRFDMRRVLILLLIILPVFGAWFCSALFVGYRPRYVLPALPFAVLWISGVIQTGLRRPGTVLLVLFAAIELVGLGQMNSAAYAREDNRSAARYIASKESNTPVVLLGQGTSPFHRYAERLNDILLLRQNNVVDHAAVTRLMSRRLGNASELWLVSARPWTIDANGYFVSFLNGRFDLREEQIFAGVTVQLYANGNVSEKRPER